jgi:hypothetical protein
LLGRLHRRRARPARRAGEKGFEVFDVAQIDHKGFSERITSAPVSPVGQRTYVRTKYATAVALPSTLGVDPTRAHLPENQEQLAHPMYGFVYVTDKHEGLVVVQVATLLDGNSMNNFLRRSATFNPGGILTGARASRAGATRISLQARTWTRTRVRAGALTLRSRRQPAGGARRVSGSPAG